MSIFRVCDRLFSLIPGPIYVQTTLAGLGLGSIAALLPLTRYFSHNELETVLEHNFSAIFLLTVAVAKMLSISLTVTGGWRGGFIIPLFFTGACLGKTIAALFPQLNPALAMICIMASLNSAVTRTPVMSWENSRRFISSTESCPSNDLHNGIPQFRRDAYARQHHLTPRKT